MQQHLSIRQIMGGFIPSTVLLCAVLLWNPVAGFAETDANGPTTIMEQSAPSEVVAAEQAEEAPSAKADVLFIIAGVVPVTNSMITGWLAAFILIAVSLRFHFLVRGGRSTMFTGTIEALVIFLNNFLSDIMGKRLARKTFWLLGSFFIFILASNWLGLLPGIGSVGWGHAAEHTFKVTEPLFRGVNADLNMTLALGALFFLFWFIWAWKENGPVGILKHIFAPQGDAKGIMYFVMTVVFLAVGLLELLSIIIRPFSLALRLYGNIFAGEVMLETMLHKVPMLGWLLPVPFYFMEALVGLIQALVFTLLSAVFVMLICSHNDTEEHSGSGPDADVQKH